MNQILTSELRFCIKCNTWLRFRIMKYGCVFACLCQGRFIDFMKVLRDYISFLTLGIDLTGYIPIIPIISGPISTDHLKIAQVELDLLNSRICLRIMNSTASDAVQIVKGFPLSLDESITTSADGYFYFPMDSFDLLIHELKLVSYSENGKLFVNEPSPEVKARVSSRKSAFYPPLQDLIPAKLFAFLHRHQIDGICTALGFDGRAIFADEMGVGKTLQAIGTIAALRTFPTLIICPAALRHLWVEEVEKWLMGIIELDDIFVISSASGFLSAKDKPKIVITSYQMTSILGNHLEGREWSCLLVDESHILHTTESGRDAQYTSLVCKIGKRSKHCLLLTGTPSLTSPFDLFNQIDTLRCGLLGENRYDFALRYCRMRFTPYLKVLECTRSVELHSLLASTCMIRRLKSNTLTELPSKQRVLLRVPETLSEFDTKVISFQEEYSTSWKRKRVKILEIVDFVINRHPKIVLFAHHIKLIQYLATHIQDKKVPFIRIDGSTPVNYRATLLSQFNNEDIRVAVIGITACSVGVRLTGARCAVFCELPPDASWMQQAEDRLHRPGQEECVTLFYILGAESFFDAELFGRLSRSFELTRQAVDGAIPSFNVSYTSHITPSTEGERNMQGKKTGEIVSLYTSSSEPFLFRISANTGRIYVTQGGSHLFNLSLDEAQHYWNLPDAFSHQLREFLTKVEHLTSVERRRLINTKIWCASDFKWTPHTQGRKIFTRYSREWPIFGKVFFWRILRRKFPIHTYGALLLDSGKDYIPMCLECGYPVKKKASFFPGDIVCTENDTEMFCSGFCRGDFYMKRSSSAIRRNISAIERGVCTLCQVDCELLCTLVAATTKMIEREAIVDKMHPQMRLHTKLFNRFIENPLPGYIWNADHVLPVRKGGGQSKMENLQTLCVACHANKTLNEMKVSRKDALRTINRTTVDASLFHLFEKASRRVTTARINGTS